MASESRDWSSLMPEIVKDIANRIPYSLDYVSFRCVCSSWRRGAPRRSFPPMLMFPNDTECTSMALFDPSTGIAREFCRDEARGKAYLGSSHGWMAMLGRDGETILLNPVTGRTVGLPHIDMEFAVASGVNAFYMSGHFYLYAFEGYAARIHPLAMRAVFASEVLLSAAPDSGNDCVAVGLLSSSTSVAICRPGDDCWNIFDTKLATNTVTAAFCGGLFYVADDFKMSAVDIGQDPPVVLFESIPLPKVLDGFRLLEWQGDLFYLFTMTSGDNTQLAELYQTGSVTLIYKFDVNKQGGTYWTMVDSVDEGIMFMSPNQSTMLIKKDVAGFSSNCLCISAPNFHSLNFWETDVHHYRVVHLQSNDVEDISCIWAYLCSDFAQWFTPNFQ